MSIQGERHPSLQWKLHYFLINSTLNRMETKNISHTSEQKHPYFSFIFFLGYNKRKPFHFASLLFFLSGKKKGCRVLFVTCGLTPFKHERRATSANSEKGMWQKGDLDGRLFCCDTGAAVACNLFRNKAFRVAADLFWERLKSTEKQRENTHHK